MMLLWVVHIVGSFITKVNPPSSLDNWEPFVRSLVLRTGCKLVHVARCHTRFRTTGSPSGKNTIYSAPLLQELNLLERCVLYGPTGTKNAAALGTFQADT